MYATPCACALPWHRHRRRGKSGKNGDLPNVLSANEVTVAVPSLARSCPSFQIGYLSSMLHCE